MKLQARVPAIGLTVGMKLPAKGQKGGVEVLSIEDGVALIQYIGEDIPEVLAATQVPAFSMGCLCPKPEACGVCACRAKEKSE